VAATIDATLKGTAANSYVTLAEANAYFETVPHDEHWTGSDDAKNRVLITATRYLDNFEYYGERCTTTQALKWPRKEYKVDGVKVDCTFIPQPVKNATFELAHSLLFKGEALVGTTGTQGTYEEVELGDLKVKFKDSSQTPGVINNILDIYPWLESFLGAYMKSGATNYAVTLKRG
jgi:hypothetical protein